MLSLFTGIFLSVYLLLGGVVTPVPPTMQFQIITVSAALGGLVIASANFGKISKKRRVELLRVGQKLITATVSFIFFIALFLFVDLSNVDPSKFAGGIDAWVRGILFWSAAFFFFGGACIFTLGLVDLIIAIKNLKQEVINNIDIDKNLSL